MKAIELHRELTRIWQGEPGWRGVFSSVSHTDLGKRFIVAAAVFFGIGGVLAMLITFAIGGAVESSASTVTEIIEEMLRTTTSEREGRAIDKDAPASMEMKKQEGYF